jgi:DNA polymerase elongation subunit (family B)
LAKGDSLRILAIDIETRPNLAYVWGLWDQNINLAALVEHQSMICWVAKWLGEDDIEFRSVHHDGQDAMIMRAWCLLDEADVVMHYNGKRFDIPWLNREFLRLDLAPPSPYKQIDLLQTARKEFKFASNKLAHVSEQLGLQGKVEHEGFALWIKCMAGDDEAWDKMREYNIRDVTLLEDLYEKLRPWIRSHPSVAAHTGTDVCPGCGSDKLTRRGFTVLTTGRYQRFQCEGCKRWSRSTKRDAGTTITSAAIS